MSRIKQRLSVPLGVIVVAAVVVAALLVVLSQMGGGEEEAQELLAGVSQDGTTLGAEDTPVTIYLYEDL